jgi:hypothetical protein
MILDNHPLAFKVRAPDHLSKISYSPYKSAFEEEDMEESNLSVRFEDYENVSVAAAVFTDKIKKRRKQEDIEIRLGSPLNVSEFNRVADATVIVDQHEVVDAMLIP